MLIYRKNTMKCQHNTLMSMLPDRPMAPGRAKVVMALGRSVTLSWATPEDDGGCKIGNYIVEYYRVSNH